MQKPKRIAQRIATIPFVAVWTIMAIVAWLITLIPVFYGFVIDNVPLWLTYLWVGAAPALMMAIMQHQLIQRTYGLLLKNWIRLSLLGGAVGGSLMFLMEEFAGIYAVPMQTTTVILAPMLVQFWLLRKHVKGAWLWLLAGLASGIAFSIPFTSDLTQYYWLTAASAAVFHGTVTALSARWLFRMNQPAPKQKTGIAQLELDQRRDNLRLSESDLPYTRIQATMEQHSTDARPYQREEQQS